jgi:ABC-type glycerol-3-phosphate transport system substrate-binding protein
MVLALASCELFESKTAKLWTDRPEFSFYVEIFNTMQSRYKVELVYSEAPAEKLRDAQTYPDIVVGSWLKSASTRNLFKPLDYFFEDLLISEKSFYSRLLSLGNIEGKQYLFPVSFNVPALIFSKENASLIGKPFILTLEEIKGLGKAYNIVAKGVYSRMGFSPRWNDEFLFVTAALHGASFREGTPLAWDGQALDKAIRFIRQWTSDANTDISSEDDFAFKYLYDPAPKMAASGRILFAYMNSADLFTIPEERRATLDFRWIAKDSQIPMVEGSTYLGIFKGGKAKSAADAFVRWFYKEETQHQLLDASKTTRLNETLFGIANGFSALKTVNEQIYPRFYPNLLGHVPPEDYLTPPNILPRDWVVVKERVILPYLHDRARLVDSGLPLDKRLNDWYRINPRR